VLLNRKKPGLTRPDPAVKGKKKKKNRRERPLMDQNSFTGEPDPAVASAATEVVHGV
jgi:hypothetical protein